MGYFVVERRMLFGHLAFQAGIAHASWLPFSLHLRSPFGHRPKTLQKYLPLRSFAGHAWVPQGPTIREYGSSASKWGIGLRLRMLSGLLVCQGEGGSWDNAGQLLSQECHSHGAPRDHVPVLAEDSRRAPGFLT